MQEVSARGGELFVLSDLDSDYTASEGVHIIRTPRHIRYTIADCAYHPCAIISLSCGTGQGHGCG